MPSAFSRKASENETMVLLEQLIKQMTKDMNDAPPKLQPIIKDALTNLDRVKQLYVSEVLTDED